MGNGGALEAMGPLRTGMDGIRGGRLRPSGVPWTEAQMLAMSTDEVMRGMIKKTSVCQRDAERTGRVESFGISALRDQRWMVGF